MRWWEHTQAVQFPGAWDPLEVGIQAIVGQGRHSAQAKAILERLVNEYGRPAPGLTPLGLSYTFPTASTLAGAPLAGLGLAEGADDTIRVFATRVADGTIHLDRSVPLRDLVASLTAVRGLNSVTADYIALRMGETDAFPASDLRLRRALAQSSPASE